MLLTTTLAAWSRATAVHETTTSNRQHVNARVRRALARAASASAPTRARDDQRANVSARRPARQRERATTARSERARGESARSRNGRAAARRRWQRGSAAARRRGGTRRHGSGARRGGAVGRWQRGATEAARAARRHGRCGGAGGAVGAGGSISAKIISERLLVEESMSHPSGTNNSWVGVARARNIHSSRSIKLAKSSAAAGGAGSRVARRSRVRSRTAHGRPCARRIHST